MTIGEKIQQLRKERGWSQEQLAAELHVSRQAISKWELDASMPEVEKIIAISQLFGISTDQLLMEKNPKINEKKEKNKNHNYRRVKILLAVLSILAGIWLLSCWYMGAPKGTFWFTTCLWSLINAGFLIGIMVLLILAWKALRIYIKKKR